MKIVLASGYENILGRIFKIIKKNFPESSIGIDISGSGNIIILIQNNTRRKLLIVEDGFSISGLIGLFSSGSKMNCLPSIIAIPSFSDENRRFYKKEGRKKFFHTKNGPKIGPNVVINIYKRTDYSPLFLFHFLFLYL